MQEETTKSFTELQKENQKLTDIWSTLQASAKELAGEADKNIKAALADKFEIGQKLSNSVIENTKLKNEVSKLLKSNEELEKKIM